MGQLDDLFATPAAEVQDASVREPYDVVIIGGGTSGLVAAMTLIEAGRSVALIEAGPFLMTTNVLDTDLRFDSTARAKIQDSLSASPLFGDNATFGHLIYCLGGRGLFWTGAAPRFNPSDFEQWPFSYAELAPYYDWAEHLFGVNRLLGETVLAQVLIRRLRAAGYTPEPGPTAIDRPGPLDNRVGGNIGNALGPFLRKRLLSRSIEQFALCTNSFATRIEHDGTTATAVQLSDASGNAFVIPTRSVVLAAGGYESVRLALHSRLPDGSGDMGRRISDHLFVRAYLEVDPATYDSQRAEQAVVYIRSSEHRPYQTEFHAPSDNLFGVDPGAWNPAPTEDYSVLVRLFAPAQSRAENRIELISGPIGRSHFKVTFAYSDADYGLLKQMQAEVIRIAQALGAPPPKITILDPGLSHHESGGLSSGNDAATSVTDGFGRFHKMPNVVVCDASSWPASTAYNPHLTIAALARRNAHFLGKVLT